MLRLWNLQMTLRTKKVQYCLRKANMTRGLTCLTAPLAWDTLQPISSDFGTNQENLITPLMALFVAHQAVCAAPLTAFFTAAVPPIPSAAVFALQQFITLRLDCILMHRTVFYSSLITIQQIALRR